MKGHITVVSDPNNISPVIYGMVSIVSYYKNPYLVECSVNAIDMTINSYSTLKTGINAP